MTVTQSKIDLKETAARSSPPKLAITVLSGGPSKEREISLQSGAAVTTALRSLGHTVYSEDIAPGRLEALDRDVNCVFIALHGAFGEDGQVQAILEARGIDYCGSGPAACALAMNKAKAKATFADIGIPTPSYCVAAQGHIPSALEEIPLPLVAKPVTEGSSLACHIVRESSQLRPAIDGLLEKYDQCLIEEYIPGKEITVGILGDRPLPPIEIRTRRDFYDYQAKYVDEETEYVFDIDLPAEVLSRIAEMSLEAHRALGCRDFSRVDWRVDDCQLKPYLLEVNVIPGLTGHSLLPKAARQDGLNMSTLCQKIVDMAMARQSSR